MSVRRMKSEGDDGDVDCCSRDGRRDLLGRGGLFGRLRGQRQRLLVANRGGAGAFLVAVVAEVVLVKELELGKGGETGIGLVGEVDIGLEEVGLGMVEVVAPGVKNKRSFVDELREIEKQV
jgi:hypothetical protein